MNIFFKRRHTDSQQVHEKVLNITSQKENTNKNIRMASTKKNGEDVEKREPLCTVGGNVNRSKHYEKFGYSLKT